LLLKSLKQQEFKVAHREHALQLVWINKAARCTHSRIHKSPDAGWHFPISVNIAVEDRVFLGMQDFDFCPNLIKF